MKYSPVLVFFNRQGELLNRGPSLPGSLDFPILPLSTPFAAAPEPSGKDVKLEPPAKYMGSPEHSLAPTPSSAGSESWRSEGSAEDENPCTNATRYVLPFLSIE
jgi:hypothetical protein